MSNKNSRQAQISILATGGKVGTFRMVSNSMRALLNEPYTLIELELPLALRRPTGGLNVAVRPDDGAESPKSSK